MKEAVCGDGRGLVRLHRWSEVQRTRQPRGAPPGGRNRIYVVDRHALMRRAAAEWINHDFNLEVCGVADGRAGAFKAIRRLHPDLVVSEIMQPQDLGFIRELHRQHPDLPILVLTSLDAALYAAQAREAGARGYVKKEAGGDAFIQNIHAILRRRNIVRDAVPTKRRCVGREMSPRLEH